jgi:tetratricopeptide (TPR) repeat protein
LPYFFYLYEKPVLLKVVQLFLLAAGATLAACNTTHRAPPIVSNEDYKKGVSLLDHQEDSAYYYFNKVATSSKDSLLVAMAYNNMAVIASDEGDYYGGQETLLASLNYLHEHQERDQSCLASDYNLLGRISQNLKNYDAAIDYYDRAIALIKNEGYKAIILNNKAVVYQDKKQYAQAIAIYESVLIPSKKSKTAYARVITNLAMARWQQDSDYRAAPDLFMALQLRSTAKDEWGLNSSYAHLADYYLHSRPDSALLFARNMYTVASRLQSPDNQLEVLQKLIRLSPPKEVKDYFDQYQNLSDSLQRVRNAAKNQFALIRYEAQKNKADNLRLGEENTRQREIIFWSIAGFALLAGGAIAGYRRRKLQIESKARNRLLKASRKMHDIIGNGIYLTMTKIEHSNRLDKVELLDKLEVLYEQSRDISHELHENTNQDFYQTTADMLKAFADPSTRVSILGNQIELWDKLSAQAKTEVGLILQELMTNMKKHSGARNVLVRFEQDRDQINIRYADDGVGFASDMRLGNGLTSTENRIKGIGGRIIFGKNTPKGLKIELYIPLG